MIDSDFARHIVSRASLGDFDALRYFPFLMKAGRLGVHAARKSLTSFLLARKQAFLDEMRRYCPYGSIGRDSYLGLIREIDSAVLEVGELKKGKIVCYRGIEVKIYRN